MRCLQFSPLNSFIRAQYGVYIIHARILHHRVKLQFLEINQDQLRGQREELGGMSTFSVMPSIICVQEKLQTAKRDLLHGSHKLNHDLPVPVRKSL
jgi:hypothetical protein